MITVSNDPKYTVEDLRARILNEAIRTLDGESRVPSQALSAAIEAYLALTSPLVAADDFREQVEQIVTEMFERAATAQGR